MALTQGAWTVKTVNNRLICTCTVATDGSDTIDLPTLKTPKELDGTKPFTVFIKSAGTIDASAAYIDLWGGYADDFVLTISSNAVNGATSGAELFAGTTDIKAGGSFALRVVPGSQGGVAQVTTFPGAVAVVPALPYYAINLDGTDALADTADLTYVIVQ